VERWKAWDEVLYVREGCQEVVYLQKIVVHARDTRRDEYKSLKIKWTSKLSLLSQTIAVNKNIYPQGTKLIMADITTQSIKDSLRNEA
jgi:hypothetical protein